MQMKRAICIFSLAFMVSWNLAGQVNKEQLKGVWGIVAMGKAGKDTVVILNLDTIIGSVFTNHIFRNVGDLINAANSPEEKIAYSVLGMFSNMFLQFDGTNNYAEGMKPETADQKPNLKRGKYAVTGNQVSVKTNKIEDFHAEFRGEYLVLTSATGSMMYLKKYSDSLY